MLVLDYMLHSLGVSLLISVRFDQAALSTKYHSLIQSHSSEANEYLTSIQEDIVLAVEQCIEAAGYEYQPSNQKELLRVSSLRPFITRFC